MDGRPGRIIYGRHPVGNIRLDSAERAIINSLSAPVHVFWHPILKLKVVDSEDWPSNRVKAPVDSKVAFTSAVFVTYQSTLQPLSNLGNIGDVWLTPKTLFWKKTEDTWMRWVPRYYFGCPYDSTRRLMFTHWAEFKYAAPATESSERREWWKGVPDFCIPTSLKEHIPGVAEILKKNHRDLDEADMTMLFNLRLDYVRLGDEARVIAARQGEPADGGPDADGGVDDAPAPNEPEEQMPPGQQDDALDEERDHEEDGPVNDVNLNQRLPGPVAPYIREDGGGQDAPRPNEPAQPIHARPSAPHPAVNTAAPTDAQLSEEEVELLLAERRRGNPSHAPNQPDAQPVFTPTHPLKPVAVAGPSREPAGVRDVSMSLGSVETDDMDIDDPTRNQLKEHISVIRRLVETMEADVEGGDQEWLDGTAAEVRVLALVARDILARRDPGGLRGI